MQPAIDILATHTFRTGSYDQYLKHARGRFATAEVLQRRMKATRGRRWSFESYRKEQRAVKKLSTDLLDGLDPKSTLVLWGNGGFKSSYKGHDSSPNQKLQKALARYVPVVVVSEYRSSKTSPCHHCPLKPIQTSAYKRRTTVQQCPSCKTLFGRDTSAAHVIAGMFMEMYSGGTTLLPDWITSRQSDKLTLLVPL